MNENSPLSRSPRWSPLTKLAVGLTIIALAAALLVRFRSILGPLLVAFVLSYLLYPVVARLSKMTKLSWRTSVNLIYLLMVILYAGVITLAGFTILQQLQSLNNYVSQLITTDLPGIVQKLSTQEYRFGPLIFNLAQYDLQTLLNQALSVVQPVVGRVGGLLSTFATSAINTFVWSLFVIVISYFLLADAGRVSPQIVSVEIPGYEADMRRLGLELRKIWNAYLRGQLIIILLVMATYAIMLSALGVRYAIGIAILAGLARFVPYIGPFVTWTTLSMVTLFQGENYFGLQQYQFAILAVALALVVDQVFDNLVSPRIFGDTLGVHPAAVLVAAIIATNLIGIIGLVLAAPVLATFNLVGRYILRKMFDLDPWPEREESVSYNRVTWMRGLQKLEVRFRALRQRIWRSIQKDK